MRWATALSRALARFRDEFPDTENPALVVAGGVAANQHDQGDTAKPCATRPASPSSRRR